MGRPFESLKERHRLIIRKHEDEIKSLRASLDVGGIKANATFTDSNSISVEVVNQGQSKIIIHKMEATFENGETETKPPYLTRTDGGNLVFKSFELNQKGDIVVLGGINMLFEKLPTKLFYIDTLGNRYPVDNWAEALNELKEHPLSIKRIVEKVYGAQENPPDGGS